MRKNSLVKTVEGGASRFRLAQPEGPGVQGPELSGGEGEPQSVGSKDQAFGENRVHPNFDIRPVHPAEWARVPLISFLQELDFFLRERDWCLELWG